MIITNTDPATVRLANREFATSFFPRMRKSIYARLGFGSFTAKALVEPFSIYGSPPVLKLFGAKGMDSNGIASFGFQSPSPLFKYIEEVDRTDLEADPTGTLIKRTGLAGIRLAQTPDQIIIAKIIKGNRTSSVTETFRGTNYTVTLDGLPLFSAAHATGPSGTTQSNIVNGTLPATVANIQAQDVAVTAQQMQRDLQAVLSRIGGIVDTAGSPLYPDLDVKNQLVVLVPRILEPAADLAFKGTAAIGGANGTGGSSGATASIGPMYVRDVISTGYLQGMIDPFTGLALTPTSPTEWYVFIVDDLAKPMYWQRFLPPGNTGIPAAQGYNASEEADRIINAYKQDGVDITPDAAAIYATASIDHNFGALGGSAQESVAKGEKFFVSPRLRGNACYGFWPTAYKVTPTGVSS